MKVTSIYTNTTYKRGQKKKTLKAKKKAKVKMLHLQNVFRFDPRHCSLVPLPRGKKAKKKAKDEEGKDLFTKMIYGEEDSNSKVTLSGLLNFIDGF